MLSDKQIKDLVWKMSQGPEANLVSPLIEPFDEKNMGPVSYDLTTEVQFQYRGVKRLVSIETICMPRNLGGIISARSRLELRGIFAAFSFLVDPGYEGKLTFLVWCPEEPNRPYDYHDLFQIMFFKVDEVEVAYDERSTSTAMGRQGFDADKEQKQDDKPGPQL